MTVVVCGSVIVKCSKSKVEGATFLIWMKTSTNKDSVFRVFLNALRAALQVTKLIEYFDWRMCHFFIFEHI